MNIINVECTKPYNIYITNTDSLQKALLPYIESKKITIIADNILKNTYLPNLLKIINNLSCTYDIFYLTALETNKQFKTVSELCQQILSTQPTIKQPVIVLGGGLIGDIAGFCVAIILRGLPLLQIPTTLLAQVDSSVGGKNGINTNQGKNTLGVIYQPQGVFIDINTLTTLSERMILAGYAECLKYALLFSKEYFNYLDKNIALLKAHNLDYLQQLIIKSCEYKAKIVKIDADEKKEIRYLLNLGHTFAHALELYNNYKASLQHGEAVAIGMMSALKLSYYLGFIAINEVNLLKEHLKNVNLPYKLSDIVKVKDCDYFISLMLKDKKNLTQQITFILAYSIGNCFVSKDVSLEQLKEFLIKELI